MRLTLDPHLAPPQIRASQTAGRPAGVAIAPSVRADPRERDPGQCLLPRLYWKLMGRIEVDRHGLEPDIATENRIGSEQYRGRDDAPTVIFSELVCMSIYGIERNEAFGIISIQKVIVFYGMHKHCIFYMPNSRQVALHLSLFIFFFIQIDCPRAKAQLETKPFC